jgi:hypothetical protein
MNAKGKAVNVKAAGKRAPEILQTQNKRPVSVSQHVAETAVNLTSLSPQISAGDERDEPQTKTQTVERNKPMTDKTTNAQSELFDQGLKNYEQALAAGVKIHEEACKYWTKMLNRSSSPQDFQKYVSSMASDVIPATQKAMDGCVELLEQTSRSSVDLLKKGFEAAQVSDYGESQAKVVEFCESSLKSLKSNAQAIVDINAKAVDSWLAFVKKATTEVLEPKAAKA